DGIRDFHVTGVQTCALPISDQRRQRILQAAQQLFAERDYEGVSVEAVAERAGVAKSLVFHHFGSKGELYLAAVADAAARISAIRSEERRVGKERRSRERSEA